MPIKCLQFCQRREGAVPHGTGVPPSALGSHSFCDCVTAPVSLTVLWSPAQVFLHVCVCVCLCVCTSTCLAVVLGLRQVQVPPKQTTCTRRSWDMSACVQMHVCLHMTDNCNHCTSAVGPLCASFTLTDCVTYTLSKKKSRYSPRDSSQVSGLESASDIGQMCHPLPRAIFRVVI